MTFWEVGTVKQRIGELVYIVQGPTNTHKRLMNQLWKCRLNESAYLRLTELELFD